MRTNERLRHQALRLIKQGVTQKTVAGRMGMSQSAFSKWLNRVKGVGPVTVDAMDGFEDYLKEFQALTSDAPPAAAADPAPMPRKESPRSNEREFSRRRSRAAKSSCSPRPEETATLMPSAVP